MARLTVADLEIERNGDPFEIEMSDGTVFAFKDPRSIQFKNLLAFGALSPQDMVRAIMDKGDFEKFAKRPEVDGYFFEALSKRYMEHYKLATPGEARASSR